MRLQTRITLTLFAFSLLVAFIVGGVGYIENESIEESIWKQMLNSELEFQIRRRENSESEKREILSNTTLYQADPLTAQEAIPPSLRNLDVGLHDELWLDGRLVCILIKDVGTKRYYLAFDITNLEEEEFRTNLIAISTIVALLGLVLWSSIYLGRWLVRPIHELAERVGTFFPSENYDPIAENYSEHEVKQIAEAIDAFRQRLSLFIRREREFISMASHEFRTPLTVIAGAADVLSAIPDITPKAEKPIHRIRKTTKELRDIISVLLLLSKEEPNQNNVTPTAQFDEIVNEVVNLHRELLTSKEIALETGLVEPTTIQAQRSLAKILVSNLIRNSIQHSCKGSIRVELTNYELRVVDSGPGIPEDILRKVNGPIGSRDYSFSSGLGLYIVRRVAERYGWRFQLLPGKIAGTIAVVSLKHPEPSKPNNPKHL